MDSASKSRYKITNFCFKTKFSALETKIKQENNVFKKIFLFLQQKIYFKAENLCSITTYFVNNF